MEGVELTAAPTPDVLNCKFKPSVKLPQSSLLEVPGIGSVSDLDIAPNLELQFQLWLKESRSPFSNRARMAKEWTPLEIHPSKRLEHGY